MRCVVWLPYISGVYLLRSSLVAYFYGGGFSNITGGISHFSLVVVESHISHWWWNLYGLSIALWTPYEHYGIAVKQSER